MVGSKWARNEDAVQRLTVEHFERKCGKGHVHEKVPLPSGLGPGGKMDIVAVCVDGRVYVCECEDRMRIGAFAGLGQLLMYRVFIEMNYDGLRAELSRRGEDRLPEERGVMTYVLALPQARKLAANEEILKRGITFIPASSRSRTELLYV
jgi:hypothetical protein